MTGWLFPLLCYIKHTAWLANSIYSKINKMEMMPNLGYNNSIHFYTSMCMCVCLGVQERKCIWLLMLTEVKQRQNGWLMCESQTTCFFCKWDSKGVCLFFNLHWGVKKLWSPEQQAMLVMCSSCDSFMPFHKLQMEFSQLKSNGFLQNDPYINHDYNSPHMDVHRSKVNEVATSSNFLMIVRHNTQDA